MTLSTILGTPQTAWLGVSGLDAFFNSHISGKLICVVLFAGSILAWSIMVTKLRHLRRAVYQSKRFLVAYRKETHPVSLFLKGHRFYPSPLATVYEDACNALGAALGGPSESDSSAALTNSTDADSERLTTREIRWVRNLGQRSMSDIILVLEDKMGLLATAVTAAPFLGLLGTVWGVMIAFGALGQAGPATLKVLAPGVSAALLTTVVGLLVALPSSIGYNIIVSRIRRLHVMMENFLDEFVSDIERRFLDDEGDHP
jgi:biopolymer transport protein TolQ